MTKKLCLFTLTILALLSISIAFIDASAVSAVQVTNAPLVLPVTVANGGTGATAIGTSMTNAGSTLNTIQDLRTTASPAFTGLTVNGSTILPSLTGTTVSIGGGALLAGACASNTVTVSGATTSMTVVASPNTYPGDGSMWSAQVTSANTVTVKVCAIVALTPAGSTYNVRVVQ